ncbi:PAAR domain-containing protein [Pseudomonas sp. BNK-15]|uniref:PAAR domain-containing protein n=1 Tax=Pseudomonas sp. BNK-15 TaxID=3376152 RepID=UPI0039BF18C5
MNPPICLGDPTSSGGSVLSCQLAGTHTVNGKTPAVLGDKASCPLHKGVFAFIEGHPSRRMNGKPVVLQGHLPFTRHLPHDQYERSAPRESR